MTDGDADCDDSGDTLPSRERTGRWLTAVAVTLGVGSVGVYFGRPSLLLAAVVGLAYTAYPLVTAELAPSLTLVRAVDDASPAHGETVTVTATVTNTGSQTVPDVRFVDGVPPTLAVTGGTPRRADALAPGESATVGYTVEASPGTHRFEPATVTCYDRSGAVRVETELQAGTGSDRNDRTNETGGPGGAGRTDEPNDAPAVSTLECSVPVDGVPSPRETLRATGRTAVDTGGSGVEFHRTREYRPGDPADRIDWRRYARTGALTTVEFRPDRRRSVVVCLDARPRSVRRAGDGEADAVTAGGAAAAALATTFLDRGARVGVARLGPRFELVAPGDGRYHHQRVTALLTAPPEESTTAFDRENAGTEPTTAAGGVGGPAASSSSANGFAAQVDEVLERTSGAAEVVIVTPLLDEFGVDAVRRAAERGRGVATLSPDVTSDESLGAELAGVERRNRIETLRSTGVPVGDWRPGDPVRWSRREGGVRRDGR
ncbi:hypothetical protein C475_12712 [Halosimplex carlsbadense 2-9-1]|uniref:DUF58 domain-containing protein n=1 Tax=Halosimplex carlsbadense 2-9-1 TaxID=797114 RepID=M0CLG2_9EURY|nr:DUF58 domain-containing protein [Halosimplex carlsbadense]ELZ24110.1 hypothetical protein C475_12712 [Halosimplex carlsbadense 2-9-1]